MASSTQPKWRALWIMSILCMCFCDRLVSAFNIILPHSTWWEALNSCGKVNGRLVTLKPGTMPLDMNSFQSGTYWTGALTYAKWRWKEQGPAQSGIYTYYGFGPVYYSKSQYIPGNSALTCHQFCKETNTFFGLQDDNCFCLGNSTYYIKERYHSEEVRCAGNYDDLCGNEDGMSIYKVDIIFVPDKISQCAYVGVSNAPPVSNVNTYSYRYKSIGYFPYILPETSCSEIKKYSACEKNGAFHRRNTICEGLVCLDMVRKTYNSARNACSLLTITKYNIENLAKAMVQALNRYHISAQQYWIGLDRTDESRWLNGSKVITAFNSTNGGMLPRCLAVHKHNSYQSFLWIDCNWNHSSVCDVALSTPHSTGSNTFAVRSSTLTTVPAVKTTLTTTTTVPTFAKTTSDWLGHNLSSLNPVSAGAKQGYVSSSKTGVYVGSAVGVVFGLALALFILVIFRQRRFCFKNESPVQGPQAVTFNTSANSLSINGSATSVSKNALASATPIAIVGPYDYVNIDNTCTPVSDEPSKPNTYYNVPVDHKKGNQEITNTPKSVSVNDERRKGENLKAVKAETANESVTSKNNDRSRKRNPRAADAQVYQLAGSVEDVDDGYFNITGHNEAEDNGIYHLAVGEDTGLYNLARPAECMTERTGNPVNGDPTQEESKESDYDALGQQLSMEKKRVPANVYDRIGKTCQDGDYDTAGVSGSFQVVDDTYNHAYDGKDYTEYNYDTVQRGQGDCRWPDYNYRNTGTLNVQDEKMYHITDELEDDESGLYHSIDDTTWEDSTEGETHLNTNDDTNYYNIMSTSKTSYDDISFGQ